MNHVLDQLVKWNCDDFQISDRIQEYVTPGYSRHEATKKIYRNLLYHRSPIVYPRDMQRGLHGIKSYAIKGMYRNTIDLINLKINLLQWHCDQDNYQIYQNSRSLLDNTEKITDRIDQCSLYCRSTFKSLCFWLWNDDAKGRLWSYS